MAESRAAEQAMAVEPATLESAVARVVEWELFTLWVRAVVAAEGKAPEFVISALQAKCPGFLESRTSTGHESLWADLLDWVELHVFQDATCEGWLDAVTYTARRNPQSQKGWRMWEEGQRDWRTNRPARYPSFDDWLAQMQVR